MVEVLEHDFGSAEAQEKVLNLTKKFFTKLPAKDRQAYGKHWKSMIEGQEGRKEKDKSVPCEAALDLFRRSDLPFDTLELIWDVACQSKEASLNQTEFLFALRMISAAQGGIKPPIKSEHLFSKSLKPPRFDSLPSEDTRNPPPGSSSSSTDDTDIPPAAGEPAIPPNSKPSSRRSTLEKPSRANAKKRRKGRHRKPRGRSFNTDDNEGLAEGETASTSSQPGAAVASGDTGSEGGDFDTKSLSLPSRGKTLRSPPTSPALTSSNSSPVGESGDPPVESESTWALTDKLRAKYLRLFPQADKDGDGFVGAREAVEYFSLSKLPKRVLREVWALANTHLDSKGLRKNEFVVAMHVMMKKKHEKLELPEKLPQCLVDVIDEEKE